MAISDPRLIKMGYGQKSRGNPYAAENQQMKQGRYQMAQDAFLQQQQDNDARAESDAIYGPRQRSAVQALAGYEQISGENPIDLLDNYKSDYYAPLGYRENKGASILPGREFYDKNSEEWQQAPPRVVDIPDDRYNFLQEMIGRSTSNASGIKDAPAPPPHAWSNSVGEGQFVLNPATNAWTLARENAQPQATDSQSPNAEMDEYRALMAEKAAEQAMTPTGVTPAAPAGSPAQRSMGGRLRHFLSGVQEDPNFRAFTDDYTYGALLQNAAAGLSNNVLGALGIDRYLPTVPAFDPNMDWAPQQLNPQNPFGPKTRRPSVVSTPVDYSQYSNEPPLSEISRRARLSSPDRTMFGINYLRK